MSDYLWDKTGEPDAEVERLETLLSSFGHTPRPLALPSEVTAEATPRPRRPGAWRRFFPARLFEPVGLVAAAALLVTFLLGAGALMRGRLFVEEGGAVSHEARRTPPQAPSGQRPQTPSSQAPTPERRESPSTPQEVANAGRVSELTSAQAKSGGGLPVVQGVPRKNAGAEPSAFVKPRPRPTATATAGQSVARTGGTGALETMAVSGSRGVASLFDGTRLIAKEQLIYALRLTGAKLKEVESKAHGADEQKTAAPGGVR